MYVFNEWICCSFLYAQKQAQRKIGQVNLWLIKALESKKGRWKYIDLCFKLVLRSKNTHVACFTHTSCLYFVSGLISFVHIYGLGNIIEDQIKIKFYFQLFISTIRSMVEAIRTCCLLSNMKLLFLDQCLFLPGIEAVVLKQCILLRLWRYLNDQIVYRFVDSIFYNNILYI